MFPVFQALFQNHLHLIDVGEERQHVHRYNTFKKVFQQIEQWMASGDFVKHAHEVDLDINDTKSLLQDFLGQVQNSKPFTPETQAMATKQLLEYVPFLETSSIACKWAIQISASFAGASYSLTSISTPSKSPCALRNINRAGVWPDILIICNAGVPCVRMSECPA